MNLAPFVGKSYSVTEKSEKGPAHIVPSEPDLFIVIKIVFCVIMPMVHPLLN